VLNRDRPRAPDSSDIQFQREHYQKVAPDPQYWPAIWDKVARIRWEGFSTAELASINAPMLIVLGDHDFVRLEHAVATLMQIPNAELAIIPDASHFALFSEPERVISVIKHFFEKPDEKIPLATPETGYQPGKTR